MKCPYCENNLIIQVGAKANVKNCEILTNMTSILTIQCDKCKHIFQVPIQSKSFMSVKKRYFRRI